MNCYAVLDLRCNRGNLLAAAAMGGSRALDEAYIEACRTLGPIRLLLFDLRVIADTFGVLAKGQGL